MTSQVFDSNTTITSRQQAAARAVAGYFIGDPEWADMIIDALRDPGAAFEGIDAAQEDI